MPIYEYKCGACGSEFEAITSYAQRNEQQCECGGHAEPQLSVIAGHRYYGAPGEGFHQTNVKGEP